MNYSSDPSTNGADHDAVFAPTDRRLDSLADSGRRIQQDASRLATHVQDLGSDIEGFLAGQVRERPYATLAAAAGVGYVLGGGLGSRLTLLAFGVATRLAMAMAARELGSLSMGMPPAAGTKPPQP